MPKRADLSAALTLFDDLALGNLHHLFEHRRQDAGLDHLERQFDLLLGGDGIHPHPVGPLPAPPTDRRLGARLEPLVGGAVDRQRGVHAYREPKGVDAGGRLGLAAHSVASSLIRVWAAISLSS